MKTTDAIRVLRDEAKRLRSAYLTAGPGVVLDHQIDSIEDTLMQARTVQDLPTVAEAAQGLAAARASLPSVAEAERALTSIGNGAFAEEFGADMG